ncbi:MAG: hypothetical protein RLZZ397_281 [Pseudomonadota bacterium]
MKRKLPSLQALSCFESAARYNSFTKAAQELALTQGAVSRQVAALEEFVGQRLFKRTAHGMTLTQVGAQYAQTVRAQLADIEQEALHVMGFDESTPQLKIASVPTFASRWLMPRWAQAIASGQIDCELHIETRTRPFMFSDESFEAALCASSESEISRWAGTVAIRLMPEKVVPVCSPWLLKQTMHQHACTHSEALMHMPLLQQSTRPMAWRDWFMAHTQTVPPQAQQGPQMELFSILAAAAKGHLGAALLPTLLIEEELESKALVCLSNSSLTGERAYYLVHPEHQVSPTLQMLIDWLKAESEQA